MQRATSWTCARCAARSRLTAVHATRSPTSRQSSTLSSSATTPPPSPPASSLTKAADTGTPSAPTASTRAPTLSSSRNSKRCFARVSRPDPVSNIRTIRYDIDPGQSLARTRLETRRLAATVKWHEYWTAHNEAYDGRFQALRDRHSPGKVPTRELSEFYKLELDRSRDAHRQFNRWWMRENFGMLLESIKVRLGLTGRGGGGVQGGGDEPGFFGGT